MVDVMNWFLAFVFLAYETVAVKSQVKWPRGTYGLPKPVSGCPAQNWQEGWRQQDLENTNSGSKFSTDLQLHMEATLTGGDVKRSFCVKTLNQVGETTSWPTGSYCVYKKNQCPFGMKSGKIKWDDDDAVPNNNRHGGTLPDGVFSIDTVIDYCCQDQGQWTDSIELPVDQPFYLLPHNSANCQRVRGAISTLEFIVYDTEENNNHDEFTPSHVFKTGNKGLPKIYYCYYKGCQHKLQNENGTISITQFPDYQYCSWSITVNQGSAVSLTFTSLNIPSCDKNNMDIHDGLDDTAPLLMRFCGDNATTGIRLRSTGNNVFITLRSGDNSPDNWNIQFQADFKTTIPYSGLSWPSGTYSLPKTSTSCPDMWIPGWRTQIMEDDKGTRESSLSPDLQMYMDVSLVDYALTRHFCTKTVDSETNQIFWPAGRYCIYKKNLCPFGMKVGSIKWDDDDNPKKERNDKDGILPDGFYGNDNGDVDTQIFYCCNDQGEWSQSIELPTDEPFYLLPHQSNNCQRVKWALSTIGSITYDTEDDNNYDRFVGSHVYTTGGKGLPTVYYCYYKSCKHSLKTDNGSFGTDHYPDYQYCSWSITVKDNMEVFLEFDILDIPECLHNQLEIYDGSDSTAPLLATYCGNNATSGNTLRSTGNIVYVMFKSGDNRGVSGATLRFQAQYRAEEPVTGPIWPSGTYGLPKTTVGCPAGWVLGSRKQYMNNDGIFKGATSSPFHMDAVLSLHGKYITRKFCIKTITNGNFKSWPLGKYCIYKKNSCPANMNEGYISWDDLDGGKNKHSGVLPDGDYTHNGDTKIYYCCRDQGNWYDAIKLPVTLPFFLLTHKSKNCQRVKGAMSTSEYITYDTENDQNRDEFKDSYPYTENKIVNPTIYYCYYEGCQYRINAESSSYISVERTSKRDFQYCSWLLSVSHGNISLTFNSISVNDCSGFVKIYDGINTQSPTLASYSCATTTGDSITSTGRNLFVHVKSGNNVRMETTVGFNATFKNNLSFKMSVAPPTTNIKTGKRTTITTTSKILTTPATTSSTKAPSTISSITTSTTLSTTTSTLSTSPPSTSSKTSLTLTQILTTPKLFTKAKTTKRSTTTAPRKTTLSMSSSTKLSTFLTQTLNPSKSPTSLRKTTTPNEPSTSSQTSRESTSDVSTTEDVIRLPDVATHETKGTKKPSEPDMTNTNTKHINSNEGNPGESTGGDDSSDALFIVIPVCVTVLVALFIVLLFYRRRKGSSTSGTGSQDGRIPLSNEEYQARYQSPGSVSIQQKGKQQVNIPCDERSNPLYEPGEDHTYCTIDDVKTKYKKELSLSSTKPNDSTYETPVDQLASTSSFNPVYEGDMNSKPNGSLEISIPSCKQSQAFYDISSLSQPSKSAYDTPREHYKTPGSPYDTPIPKNTQNASPNDRQTDPGNKGPNASYENVSKDNNNSHYQTPIPKPNIDIYEEMRGKEECNLLEVPGTTPC